LPWVFAITFLVSASLLFVLQPMIGKILLPKFGGSPAVWTACMLFFQAALLVGYAYAHWSPDRLGVRKQGTVHCVLLLLPVLLLPLGWLVLPFAVMPLGLAADWAPPGEIHPVPVLLLVLGLTIGVPFFVLAATAPLLQRWYSSSDRPTARDPYYFYAASNLGSMVALLSYPVLIEPLFGLTVQSWFWVAAYLGCAALIFGCLMLVRQAPVAVVAAEPVPVALPAPALETAFQEEPSFRVPAQPPPAADMATAVTTAPTDARLAIGDIPEAIIVSDKVTWSQRLLWVFRAFVPSSLMLGLTMYFTTDIAPIPLLWIIPLAVYLLSFIVAFSRLPAVVHKLFVLAMPGPVLFVITIMNVEGLRFGRFGAVLLMIHLAALFAVAMVCHGELAQTRPSARHLTDFYIWIAVGGVLGGLFNALVAPFVFTRLAEYPLALVLACLAIPSLTGKAPVRWRALPDLLPVPGMFVSGLILTKLRLSAEDFEKPGPLAASDIVWLWLFGVLCLLGIIVGPIVARKERISRAFDFAIPLMLSFWAVCFDMQAKSLLLLTGVTLAVIALSLGLMVIYVYNRQVWASFSLMWPILMALTMGMMLMKALGSAMAWSSSNFDTSSRVDETLLFGMPLLVALLGCDRPIRFGLGVGAVLLVTSIIHGANEPALLHTRSFFGVYKVEKSGNYHRLLHGTTLHGMQSIDEKRRDEALTYYHRTSPVGEILVDFERRDIKPPLAVIGLGVGTMASHAQPGQEIDFYEIDPAMVQIARNPEYFTYVTDAEKRGAKLQIILGDGRLQLGKAPDGHYGLIVVDAFNSDAIPTHLFTREAVQLFMRKLAPNGILAFHISNRYLKLAPVLGNIARDLGLQAIRRFDNDDALPGKNSSDWVMLARNYDDYGEVPINEGWDTVDIPPGTALWTDDFTNLLGIYRWQD
jgi:hypothetical protein